MRVIQLSVKSWLVVDDLVKPRFLITRAPMVNRSTGETHVVHRVDRWNHISESRHTVAVCDGEMAARDWCKTALENAERARVRGHKPGTNPATGLPTGLG